MGKTVFVLGAGASMPYGLPSGQQLVDNIIKNGLSKPDENQRYTKMIYNFIDYVYPDQIENFSKTLRDSKLYSIDTFLNVKKQKGFVELGKLLIAWSIIEKEDSSKLFGFNKRGEHIIKNDWYRLFANYYRLNYNLFKLGDYKILTFNYDRSLEVYLLEALQHTIDGENQEDLRLTIFNSIIHVYGSLGNIPLENSKRIEFIPYGFWSNLDSIMVTDNFENIYSNQIENRLQTAIDNLHIISDARQGKNKALSEVKNAISEATNIYFLGFGYDETNLQILGLKDKIHYSRKSGASLEIRGTVYEWAPEKIDKLYDKLFSPRSHMAVNKSFYNKDCYSLFDDLIL